MVGYECRSNDTTYRNETVSLHNHYSLTVLCRCMHDLENYIPFLAFILVGNNTGSKTFNFILSSKIYQKTS